MSNPRLEQRIETLRALHSRPEPLVISNVWDVMSARLAQRAGDPVIGTTSAGISRAHGYADKKQMPRRLVIQSAYRIARSIPLPLTVDIEDGLLEAGETMQDLARDLIRAEVAGINLDDSATEELLSLEVGSRRISQLRESSDALAYPLFINARIDSLLAGTESTNSDLIERGNAYLYAGADCVFIPGLADLDRCRSITAALNGPLNVIALPGGPSVADFSSAGVARVSAGSELAEAVCGHGLTSMRSFRGSGLWPATLRTRAKTYQLLEGSSDVFS